MPRLTHALISPRRGMRYHRLGRGIPMRALAEQTGFSADWLYDVENGKAGLYLEHAVKIAQALEVPCDALL